MIIEEPDSFSGKNILFIEKEMEDQARIILKIPWSKTKWMTIMTVSNYVYWLVIHDANFAFHEGGFGIQLSGENEKSFTQLKYDEDIQALRTFFHED